MNRIEKAEALREKGYSYRYISHKTGLAPSTLSYHLRDIPYSPNEATLRAIGKARAASGKTKAKSKRDSIQRANEQARTDIGRISERDMFMLGLGLYIGEGSKTHDIIRVVNMDYRVIRLFIRWLMRFGYTQDNFVIRIHLYPDSSVDEAERYWRDATKLPARQFQKPCIDRRVNKDRKRNSLHKYGTAHVTVRSGGNKDLGVAFSRRIGAWMREVLE